MPVTYAFVFFGSTTLYCNSRWLAPLNTVAYCLPMLALWSRAANRVQVTVPL